MSIKPRYPIYIPSKGRSEESRALTIRMFQKHDVSFYVVIEEQEYDLYSALVPKKQILILPFSNRGSVIPARNWIKEHSITAGDERHWQFDDNISYMYRLYKGERIMCDPGPAIAVGEDFVDRYENIAIAGFEYGMFGLLKQKPFVLNCRVYSSSLVLNSIPHEWRGTYNEDTDICLQVLADGWCTVLIGAFQIEKQPTMTMTGGNTSELYDALDGRLKMARSLERRWPGVVTTKRRFGRPQHVIKDSWRRFDTPLKKKADVAIPTEPNEYGLRLRQIVDEIKSPDVKEILNTYTKERETN